MYIYIPPSLLQATVYILLTAAIPEGIGKTTVIKRVCSMVQKHRGDVHVSGFYTEEVREGGRGGRGARVGFDVVTLEGERGVLARLSGYILNGLSVHSC